MSHPGATLLILNPEQSVIYDTADEALLGVIPWKAYRRHRSWYAGHRVTKGQKSVIFWMHRMVAATPTGMVCHHRNRNSLDNRRANLLNMNHHDHDFLHKNNTLTIKFEGNTA